MICRTKTAALRYSLISVKPLVKYFKVTSDYFYSKSLIFSVHSFVFQAKKIKNKSQE